MSTRLPLSLTAAAVLSLAAGCLETHREALFGRKAADDAVPEVQLVADRPGWFRKKAEPVKSDSVTKRESNVAVRKVALDGQGLVLGETDDTGLTSESWLALLQARQQESPLLAACLVRRSPEVTQRVLLEELTAETPVPSRLEFMARLHDEQTRTLSSAWQTAARERLVQPDRFREFCAARRRIHLALTQGQPLPATKPLPELLPKECSPVWTAEAWSLTGMIRLLNEQPEDAARAFHQSLRVSAETLPCLVAQTELLLAEALRRDGHTTQAVEVWQSAVIRASQLLSLSPPVMDASFWDRACYLRPHQTEWPVECTQAVIDEHARRGWSSLLRDDASQPGLFVAAETTECLVWSVIGQARFDRDEPQAALIAFKKAESLAREADHAALWQLAQARALIRLGQTAPATALLMKHAQHPSPQVSLPSLALLGTLKLQAGQGTVGLSLLRRALESYPDAVWPGQLEARADFALASLMCGDDAVGLAELHAAQQAFQQRGETSLWLASLQNELAYYEARKNRDEAEVVRQRLAGTVPGTN